LLLVGTNNFRYTFPVTIVGMGILAGACCVMIRFVVRRLLLRTRRRRSAAQITSG